MDSTMDLENKLCMVYRNQHGKSHCIYERHMPESYYRLEDRYDDLQDLAFLSSLGSKYVCTYAFYMIYTGCMALCS